MSKQVDKNLIINTSINKPGVKFYDVLVEPFYIYGVWYDGDGFYRVPKDVAPRVSPSTVQKSTQTAGGRIRFKTDSQYVAIKAVLQNAEKIAMMTATAARGFDLYADGIFIRSFTPPYDQGEGDFESVVNIGERTTREITINMPLYSGVKELYIGVDEEAALAAATPYKYSKPVVFYGSSITNGACASRPGMAYEAILSRMLDMDFHNLGFGGSAKGEPSIAEYIAGLEMSVFVYDYDHNAPNPEHLRETHEPMFKLIRAAQPKLPIIMISRPQFSLESNRDERYEIIKSTYDNAIATGDENVYLLRGYDFFDGLLADFTVDGVHPTDLGFYYMAKGILPALKLALEKQG